MTNGFKLGLLLLSGVLSACGTAPGMYMEAPASPTARSTWFGAAASEPEPAIDFTLIRLSGENMGKFAQAGVAAAQPLKAAAIGPYLLGEQDVLRINVWGHPDFLPTLSAVSSGGVASVPLGRTINEDGKLFFPLVGALPAAGLTVAQFRERLTQALTKKLPAAS